MKLQIAALLLLLITGACSLKAQQTGIYIENFTTTDQVLNGEIDGKYAITAYLKFEAYSPDNLMIYSVSGWYYYNNVKKKIPLVGIRHLEGITLYSFNDKQRADSVLQMASPLLNTWQMTEELCNRSGYAEKFEISYMDYNYAGKWKSSKKELDVSFHTRGHIDLHERHEYLVLPLAKNEKKHIALNQFGPYSYGYVVFAAKSDPTGHKVLIQYEVGSNSNLQGMCGAGQEIGYLLLIFDPKGNLLDYRIEEVESCRENLWSESEEVPNSGGKKIVYTITDSRENVHTVTVDGINFTLVSK